MAFVPGSHRRARQPNPGEGVDEAIPVEAPAGSLVVWTGNMWHGAFPRQNDGLRLVLTCSFNRPYLRTQEDYRRTVTQEILDQNPDRLAVLLGLSEVNGWEDSKGPDYVRTNAILKAASREAGISTVSQDFVRRGADKSIKTDVPRA